MWKPTLCLRGLNMLCLLAPFLLQKKISLADALCGANFRFKHLDGRILTVSTTPGEVIKPDTFKRINDEGMPIHGRPFMKGNLYIHFTVDFPDRLDAAQVGCVSHLA